MTTLESLHGSHYTLAAFDAEVEKLVNEWKEGETEDVSEADIRNARTNFAQNVFNDWNNLDFSDSRSLQFGMEYGSAQLGYATMSSAKNDGSNPLLEPIHGISLQDYAVASAKMANGVSVEAIAKALGIEKPVWDEASTLWIARMQEDSSFTVTTLFSTYFGDVNSHPKLGSLTSGGADGSNPNLEKLENDRYFYEELCGARQAAYEYGLDGAQWILDNYGISLGDFQAVAMKHMQTQNNSFDADKIIHFSNYMQEKQSEYAAKFAAEQGGNVADDVEF
jgi:hypothetical protein